MGQFILKLAFKINSKIITLNNTLAVLFFNYYKQ